MYIYIYIAYCLRAYCLRVYSLVSYYIPIQSMPHVAPATQTTVPTQCPLSAHSVPTQCPLQFTVMFEKAKKKFPVLNSCMRMCQ